MNNLQDTVLKAIPWSQVPHAIKQSIDNNEEVYNNELRLYSLERVLAYEHAPARIIYDELTYYSTMLTYMKQKLKPFPYQFANIIVNKLHTLPFQYYTEMLVDIMKQEKSYDILPNFTAADIVQLMGIGRNQYIDIMNKARSQKWVWKINKGIVAKLLPQQPIKIPVQYWWVVEPVEIDQKDFVKIFNNLPEAEQLAIGLIKKEGKLLACKVPYESLLSLFVKGLVHFHVPVNDDDYIVVPPLTGFIMNRMPDGHFEKLIYDILVTIDERTSVVELANVLETPVSQVKNAVSVCLRLGFCVKKLPKPKNMDENSEDQFHNSWQEHIDAYHKHVEQHSLLKNTGEIKPNKKLSRIGFLFDSSLTAYLMMGNLADGLKNHAVTLFEVGKMPDELLDDFLTELDKIKTAGEGEGEAMRYYRHAISLRSTLRFLRKNSSFDIPNTDGGVDMVRCESLNNLDLATKLRVLTTNYCVLIAMAPLTAGSLVLPSCIPRFYGPPLPQVSSPWFKLYTYVCCSAGPQSILFAQGRRIRKLPPMFNNAVKVRYGSWIQEPNNVHIRAFLQALNSSLTHSPTFVQISEFKHTKVETFELPFPYIESSKTKDFYDDDEKKQALEIIDCLTEKMHLEYSFGTIKMERHIDKDGKLPNRIVPVELIFGIPLSNEDMNERVCKVIAEKKILQEENIKKQSTCMKQMCTEFLLFIENNLDTKLRMGDGKNYPTSNIYFDGTKINKIHF